MDRKILAVCFLLLVSFASPASALKIVSGDNVVVDEPIDDDVVAYGGIITFEAPVKSILAVGGDIDVRASVENDVVAVGGNIEIDADVGGKVAVAGGNVVMKGSAYNLIVLSANTETDEGSSISKDAFMLAGMARHSGTVDGVLTVKSDEFENTGTAGHVDYENIQFREKLERFYTALQALGFLMLLGLLLFGSLLITVFPRQFHSVDSIIMKSPAKKAAMGFMFIVSSTLFALISAATVVGLPLAAVSAMIFLITVMLSGFFVAFSFGKEVSKRLGLDAGDVWVFSLGFLLLCILFLLPYVGVLISVIALSLGFGSVSIYINDNISRFMGNGKESVKERISRKR